MALPQPLLTIINLPVFEHIGALVHERISVSLDSWDVPMFWMAGPLKLIEVNALAGATPDNGAVISTSPMRARSLVLDVGIIRHIIRFRLRTHTGTPAASSLTAQCALRTAQLFAVLQVRKPDRALTACSRMRAGTETLLEGPGPVPFVPIVSDAAHTNAHG